MSDVEQQIQARLTWVRLYASTQDAGLVCRRCGISRPTLRKWWRRFRAHGLEGLREHSRRPRKTPTPKVTSQYEVLILQLRRERNLGAKRIQAELL
ncbi:MAG: helix-turn-helix domain-containing protein, partial [Acidobacteria bacterium]|nr:helix-turn-helix domain-containing protein [Acidobacteriota bacterium]MCA1618590.1 helix-turn-helix domain-containing protein [Acidobacteriota bacterium]